MVWFVFIICVYLCVRESFCVCSAKAKADGAIASPWLLIQFNRRWKYRLCKVPGPVTAKCALMEELTITQTLARRIHGQG